MHHPRLFPLELVLHRPGCEPDPLGVVWLMTLKPAVRNFDAPRCRPPLPGLLSDAFDLVSRARTPEGSRPPRPRFPRCFAPADPALVGRLISSGRRRRPPPSSALYCSAPCCSSSRGLDRRARPRPRFRTPFGAPRGRLRLGRGRRTRLGPVRVRAAPRLRASRLARRPLPGPGRPPRRPARLHAAACLGLRPPLELRPASRPLPRG